MGSMSTTTKWATTAETCALLRIGRSSLLGMRDRSELTVGRHWFKPAHNRIRWNPEAVLQSLIKRTPAKGMPLSTKAERAAETYDMAGLEA